MSDELFEKMLREGDVPVTDAEMEATWQQINEEEGSLITNDSNWSPFWRLITAIVTAPCKMLVKLLVQTALPNLFLKYASGAWLDVYAWGVDLTRKEATKAEGVLTVTRTASAGALTIEKGTVFTSPSLDGTVYRVVTTKDTTAQDGTLEFTVPVEAEATGSAYNLGPGYYSIAATPLTGVASVTNGADWLTTPGANQETDEELRLRSRNQFSAVGQFHHDAAYKVIITEFCGVRTDYLFFEHDAPRGPGTANCYIMLDTGAPPQEFVDAINTHVADGGFHGHGDDMQCSPMPETAHDLTVTVYKKATVDEEGEEALLLDVENRIRCAFRENTNFDMTQTWPYSRFSLSQLDKDLHAGLTDLLSVEFDRSGDIVSGLDLPVLGTLTVVPGT